jgi:hypothetical protein
VFLIPSKFFISYFATSESEYERGYEVLSMGICDRSGYEDRGISVVEVMGGGFSGNVGTDTCFVCNCYWGLVVKELRKYWCEQSVRVEQISEMLIEN